MSAEHQPFLDVSGALDNVIWMQRLTLTGDPLALERLADQLNTDLPEDPSLLLVHPGQSPYHANHSSLNVPGSEHYIPTARRPGDFVIEWAPKKHYTTPEHEADLNMAIADALLDREHAKERQLAAIWGGAIAVAGAIVGGAGEFVAENDIMTLTGAGLFLAGFVYVVHKQKRPKTPDVSGADPPVRVERDTEGHSSGAYYF